MTGSTAAAAGQPPNQPPTEPPTCAAAPAGTAGESADTVTLLTGDQVRVDRLPGGGEAVSVKPGPGRERMSFARSRPNGTITVVPADALALLDQGLLDRRLFDVTGLIAAHYDDRSRPTLPLIVQSSGGPATLAASPGVALSSIGARAVGAPKAGAGEFWQTVTSGARQSRSLAPGVTRIWLDGQVEATLDRSVPQIGAPAAWQAGYTGQGVRTAVLDTGIDATHPDLTVAVELAADFTGNPAGATDGSGHGTHVASIVTGNGSASGGRFKGVAPDTRLLVGKVLDDTGHGSESTVIAGMQWATEHGARVVGMSLSSGPGDGLDPTSLALNNLTASTGALFVVAAGNDGRRGAKVSNPGAADAALTVGAVDHDDKLADFSSQGPRLGDNAVKPELTAPGVAITAARAAGTAPELPADQRYLAKSGTSMATPHVAGAAALLAQQHPDWRADRLRAALVQSAAPTADPNVFAQGAGRVDVARAITRTVFASEATVNLYARWGHTQPVTKAVTYRNDGADPITLDLRLTGDVAGVAALDTDRLTIPAHGSATTTLSFPAPAGTTGIRGGVLVATGSTDPTASPIRVPVGTYAEPEMYDLTLNLRDRNGDPLAGGGVALIDPATGKSYQPTRHGDVRTIRLPRGHYSLTAMIYTPTGSRTGNWTVAGRPELDVTADTALTLDAREAKPVTVAVDDPTARVEMRNLAVHQTILGQPVDSDVTVYDPDAPLFALPTAPTKQPYGLVLRAFLGADQAYYNLTLPTEGGIPQEPSYRVRAGDLAAVRVDIHHQGRTGTGALSRLSALDGSRHFSGWFHAVRFPQTGTEYFSADPGIAWDGLLQSDDGTALETQPTTAYTPGRNAPESWNGAVLAPFAEMARCADTLGGEFRPFSASGFGHRGSAREGDWTGRLALFNGDRQLSETTELTYPQLPGMSADPAQYAVRLTASRPAGEVSTEVRAEWTFTSSRPTAAPGCARSADGLLATRITGDFDQDGHASAGRPFVLRINVEGTGSAAVDVRTFGAEASFDGGTTWHIVPALPVGKGRYVALVPPNVPGTGDGAVALRTVVRDAAGNGLTQTITRAYTFARP
ncbi:S8 family serine peptidase [Embleya sp. AB8]|uniref:S8 family serine peptidase n=1 Tax=Embleya sp. AB8 TaxID=3156304 RepID=UPI003C738D87